MTKLADPIGLPGGSATPDEPARRRAPRALAGRQPVLPWVLTQAAHRLAHRLNNDLALPVGVLELLADHADLPPHLRTLVQDARRGVADAWQHVEEFQGLLPEAT
jgi:hypothetical protein